MNYDEQDNINEKDNITEETSQNVDDGGYYAEIHDDDQNDGKPERKPEKPKMRPTAWRLMLEVLSNPIEGWKSIRRNRLTPVQVQSECFYPMVAMVAITEFAVLYYQPDASLSKGIVDALCGFVSVFFSYFAISVCAKILMPGEARHSLDTPFGKVFLMIALSTLCFFYSLLNLLPMLEPLLVFLPLWTVYIVCRGVRFLKFPKEREHTATALLCLMIVGMPSLIGWIFSKIVNPL